jgi:hypothetical protein
LFSSFLRIVEGAAQDLAEINVTSNMIRILDILSRFPRISYIDIDSFPPFI